MSHQEPTGQPERQTGSFGAAVLILCLLLPGVLAASHWSTTLAKLRWAWPRVGVIAWMRRIVCVATLAATVLGLLNWETVSQTALHSPLFALECWVAYQCGLFVTTTATLLPRIAVRLVRGELVAGDASAIRAAVWAATVSDAGKRLRRLQRRKRTRPGYLGVALQPDRRPWVNRLLDETTRRAKGWVSIDGVARLKGDGKRILLLGASGHGKTVAIFSMVLAALVENKRQILVDCKGLRKDADELAALAEQHGKRVVVWPDTPMDLWRVDKHAAISIVMSVVPDHDYWNSIVLWVLDTVTREAGPWNTTQELLERLVEPERVVSSSRTLATLRQRVSGVPAHLAVHQIVSAKFAPIAKHIDGGPGSWKLDDEDLDLVIISADVGAHPHLKIYLAAFVAAFNAYRVSHRSDHDRPLGLAIDEIQVLLTMEEPPDLPLLAEACRNQNIGLIYATQSIAGLGRDRDRLLGAGMDLMIGRLDEPARIAELAGTRVTMEMGWQKKLRSFTSTATARDQHVWRLDPNLIRLLERGVWVVIERGRIAFIMIDRPLLRPVKLTFDYSKAPPVV